MSANLFRPTVSALPGRRSAAARWTRAAAAGAWLAALAACASGPRLDDAQRLALYRAHAGAPVDSLQYFGRIDGWTPLGANALALWTRPNQAYLLELKGPCTDLDFANAINVTHQFGRVHANFDKVLVLGPGTHGMPCFIDRILPLDVKAIRQAERDKRAAAAQPAAAEPDR